MPGMKRIHGAVEGRIFSTRRNPPQGASAGGVRFLDIPGFDYEFVAYLLSKQCICTAAKCGQNYPNGYKCGGTII